MNLLVFLFTQGPPTDVVPVGPDFLILLLRLEQYTTIPASKTIVLEKRINVLSFKTQAESTGKVS